MLQILRVQSKLFKHFPNSWNLDSFKIWNHCTFFALISTNYLLDLENPTITTQFQPETTKTSSSYSSNHKDHQNMFQTTSPFDCTKYPYGCCPEDPFPNMVNGGCSPDCLCNPLGTFNFYIHSQCQCCQLCLLIFLPA